MARTPGMKKFALSWEEPTNRKALAFTMAFVILEAPNEAAAKQQARRLSPHATENNLDAVEEVEPNHLFVLWEAPWGVEYLFAVPRSRNLARAARDLYLQGEPEMADAISEEMFAESLSIVPENKVIRTSISMAEESDLGYGDF